MEESDKRRLKANYVLLVENLRVQEVQDLLYQYDVLTDEDMEEISLERGITPQAAVRRLVRIIQQRGPRAFLSFCKTLDEKGYEFISEKLRSTDPENVDITDSSHVSYEHYEKMETLQKQLWMQTELIMKYKEDIDQLRAQLSGQASETSELRKKFQDLENNVYSINEGEVVTYLKDYMDQQHVSLENMDEMDSSGLPRPRSGSDIRRFANAEPSSISLTECISRDLGKDIVLYVAGSSSGGPPNQYAATMRRTVEEVYKKHGEIFHEIFKKLNINDKNGYAALKNISDNLFENGTKNWGRIVALYAFGGYVAKNAVENGMPQLAPVIGDFLGFYASKNLAEWIDANGGWDGFNSFFKEHEDQGGDMKWKSMLLTAIGLGALVTLVKATR